MEEKSKSMKNKEPVAINGFLNMNWLKEKAKEITPEKEKAILKRNEALSQVPVNERRKWLETHPLESLMRN